MRCCICGEHFETDLPCQPRALMACSKPSCQRMFKLDGGKTYYWRHVEERRAYQRQYYRRKTKEAIHSENH